MVYMFVYACETLTLEHWCVCVCVCDPDPKALGCVCVCACVTLTLGRCGVAHDSQLAGLESNYG